MTNEQQNTNAGTVKKDLFLPVSIVIAALLIGGAIVWSTLRTPADPQAAAEKQQAAAEKEQLKLVENVAPITSADHILGDPNAPVKIISFTDLECPFCKVFHETMQEALVKYDGKVAFVYRNFPLSSIHQFAQKEAEAAECVADLGGNEAYWEYVGKIFASTKSNDGLDQKLLPTFAKEVGVDTAKFNACLTEGKMTAKVAAQAEDGANAGVQGTPFSIVIAKNGKKSMINGAYPMENPQQKEISVSYIIDQALK